MRWIAEGTWTSTSALHCGEPSHSGLAGTDMPLTRTAAGHVFIPAASLTGAARHYVARHEMEPADFETSDRNDQDKIHEPDSVRLLFGSRMDYASTLIVDDGHLDGEQSLSIRDGVRIDSKSGLAFADEQGGAKFDAEVVPAGTKFRLRFEFRPPSGEASVQLHEEMLGVFGLVLQGFAKGEIRLGARTRRGYGAGTVDRWRIRQISEPAHYVAWLKRESNAGIEVSLDSLAAPVEDRRKYLEILLWLRLETSLLIRSGGSGHKDPDTVHLTENNRPQLSGTSVAGVFRHRCERIAATFFPDTAAARIESMFGPLKKQGEGLKASRVHVDECPLHDTVTAVHTRVAIDPFTQASLESKLFEEAPAFPLHTEDGHVRALRIRLDAPRHDEAANFDQDAGLLLLAVKDLWLADLTLGGGAGVGRGVFRGIRAEIRSHLFKQPLSMAAAGDQAEKVRLNGEWEDWKRLNSWCDAGKEPQ